MSRFISLKEAAAMLGVGEDAVRKLFDDGKVGGQRTPGGQRRLLREDVEKLAETLTAPKDSIFFKG